MEEDSSSSMFLHTLVMLKERRLVCFFFRLVPFPFSFSKRREGRAVRRRTRSGREFPLLMWLLLLSWAREETTMTSQKDRVVRGRTAPDTTMPEQRSRKNSPGSAWRRRIAARCVLLSLHDELEASGRCLVLKMLTSALNLTEALREYGLTELTIGLQNQV